MKKNKATFGAGCFWCVEAVFQRLNGVEALVSGYMGGSIKNPTYREICSGLTGHAEVVEITYDEDIISFAELLEVLWTTHDPTTLNRQGADKGTQYRSVVFYHDDTQKEVTERSIKEVASELYDDPIVTEVSPVDVFYSAEVYHQDYFNRNKFAPYCLAVINPKVAKLKQKFKSKLKS